MADKMMRVAGRTPEGLAKAITANKDGAIKIDKQTAISKVRGATIAPGAMVGLFALEEDSVFNTVQVSVSLSVINKSRLHAQHGDEIGTDYGTTDNFEREQKTVTMRATKRSSKLGVFFTNLGSEPVTINADIVSSTEMAKDNNLMHSQNGEFRQRGDAQSGASYTRLFATDLQPVSVTNPLAVQVTNQTQSVLQVDEYGKAGTQISLGAEKDSNGQGVLRTIDASPHAYDSEKDSLNVINRHNNWTLKLSGEALAESTRAAEIARYHVVKKIIISASLVNAVVEWELFDGVNMIAEGFAHGSEVIELDSKITEGNSTKLTLSTSDSATLKGVIVGETLGV